MTKIYTLSDPITGKVRYIGKTKRRLKDRWYSHCSKYRLNRLKSHKNSWIKGLIEKDLKPVIQLLDLVPNEDWGFWEIYWIRQFKSWGFNLVNTTEGGKGSNGGRGSLGYRHTEDAKKRISMANSKSRNKTWISNSANANKKPISQYSLKGVHIRDWKSSTDAGLFLGDKSKKKNITACCKKKRKSAYGYIWKYKS